MEPTISQFLLSQGVLGFTTLMLATTTIFLYREMKAARTQHAIEIAAERKLNAELQENRLNELRNALAAVTKVTETLDAATAILHKRIAS